ncbi:MAG: EamA family transporter [Sulfobacillus benefaciens]|uniref:EamA family transporter n=1 Tax=Sulfobacillus benefaciens TaxID=453960 RepID=A0A2T2X1J1_9FIRM|nr:MAG: EamA family transporter [Sulfobacillus benefaciens]
MNSVYLMSNISDQQAAKHHARSVTWQWIWGMLSIVLVTAIWGYSNVVIRQGEATIAPAILLWMRFGIGGLVLLPVLYRARITRRSWILGLGLGIILGMSILAQGWAMLSVPVDDVAFITALYVVFTPLGLAILQRKKPARAIGMSVVLSLIGVMLLVGHFTYELRSGIFWSLGAAVGLSAQIIGTRFLGQTISSIHLTGLESLGAAVAMTVVVVVQGVLFQVSDFALFRWNTADWAWVGYLALVATVVAVFLQSWGQTKISATEAALAFNMEPVWTALFALIVLSQGMTIVQIVGALCIVGSLTVVSRPHSTL